MASALLGAVILTNVTQVSGRVRSESGAWMPLNPAAPARMPFRSDVAMRSVRTDMSGAAPQLGRPLESHAPPGRSLVLTGIIAFTDPRQGFAIIGSSVQDTYLARPGEQLPDGSLIREIHPNHVVLEYGGRLETVGIYERGEHAGAVYVQIPPPLPPPPLPQQARWEEAELKAATGGDGIPSQAPRPTDEPASDPRPDTRASETAGNERRSFDTQSSDSPQKEAQPQAPAPSAQDPADELGDDRRQRAESRRK